MPGRPAPFRGTCRHNYGYYTQDGETHFSESRPRTAKPTLAEDVALVRHACEHFSDAEAVAAFDRILASLDTGGGAS